MRGIVTRMLSSEIVPRLDKFATVAVTGAAVLAAVGRGGARGGRGGRGRGERGFVLTFFQKPLFY